MISWDYHHILTQNKENIHHLFHKGLWARLQGPWQLCPGLRPDIACFDELQYRGLWEIGGKMVECNEMLERWRVVLMVCDESNKK